MTFSSCYPKYAVELTSVLIFRTIFAKKYYQRNDLNDALQNFRVVSNKPSNMRIIMKCRMQTFAERPLLSLNG